MSAEHAEVSGITKTINAKELSEILDALEIEFAHDSGEVAVKHAMGSGPDMAPEVSFWLPPEEITDSHSEGGRF